MARQKFSTCPRLARGRTGAREKQTDTRARLVVWLPSLVFALWRGGFVGGRIPTDGIRAVEFEIGDLEQDGQTVFIAGISTSSQIET
jgi:hypothetical protein